MLDKYIAEATDCEFKAAVELGRPKSWLKTVSAFADGIGGTFFFGIDDEKRVIGLSELKKNDRQHEQTLKRAYFTIA